MTFKYIMTFIQQAFAVYVRFALLSFITHSFQMKELKGDMFAKYAMRHWLH